MGHFPVCPEVEDQIGSGPDWGTLAKQADQHETSSRQHDSQDTAARLSEISKVLSAGASGVVVNKAMNIPSSLTAFSGQGHSMLPAATTGIDQLII